MQLDRKNNSLFFMKMHGLGNDFVIIDTRDRDAVTTSVLARKLGDRRRGVGFDQLAEIRPGSDTDIGLDFWNADGSRAGACGNATRCVAQFVMAESGADHLSIRTARGVLFAESAAHGQVSVNMGLPELDWQSIPIAGHFDTLHLPLTGDPVAVGMGNPHCVYFVDDVCAINVAAQGAATETNPLFPDATNVEFAQIRSRDEIRIRVWERGAGITLACGSGACAVAVAAHRRGLVGKTVDIEADGGWLHLDWRQDGVWMTGQTAHVFDATLDPSIFGAHE